MEEEVSISFMIVTECKKVLWEAGDVFGLGRWVKRLPVKIHATAGF